MAWVDVRVGETPAQAAVREQDRIAEGLAMRIDRIRRTCLEAREKGVKVKPETILFLINE